MFTVVVVGVFMDSIKRWFFKEKRKIRTNEKRLKKGKPLKGPEPPPIPGVDVRELPDLEKEMKKIPKPEEIFTPPPPPSEVPDALKNVMVGSKHESFGQAALADVIDVIPYAGDASNVIRTVDAGLSGEKWENRRVATQSADLALGFIPDLIPGVGTVVGTVLDVLTPTNIFNYLADQYDPPKKPSVKIDIPEGEEVREFLESNFQIEVPPAPDEVYRDAMKQIEGEIQNILPGANGSGVPNAEFWDKVAPDIEDHFINRYGMKMGRWKTKKVLGNKKRLSPAKKKRMKKMKQIKKRK